VKLNCSKSSSFSGDFFQYLFSFEISLTAITRSTSVEDCDELCSEPNSKSLTLTNSTMAVTTVMGANSEAEAMEERFAKGKLGSTDVDGK
jgi:hypothetical protein